MRTALIVGAGIGGLAAGVALRRVGWRARIFERAAAPRELGFALNLAPNAVAALRALGVAGRIEAEAHRTRTVELRRLDGRPLKRLDVAALDAPAPALMALRQTVHGALLDATPAGDLALGSAGAGFEPDGDGVRLVLADGRRERGDVLIGADGLGSAIRRALHPGEPPPRDSGLCAVRGVVRGVTAHLGGLSGAVYLGRGCEAAMIQAGGDAIYWFVSVRASTVASSSPDGPSIARALLARLPPSFRAVAEASSPDDLRYDALVDRDPIARGARDPSRCSATPHIRCCRRPGRARRRRSRTRWRSAKRWPSPVLAPRRCALTSACVRPARRRSSGAAGASPPPSPWTARSSTGCAHR